MRLIDDYVADIQYGKIVLENACRQPFGGKIEELEVPVGSVVQGGIDFAGAHSHVDGKSLDAPGFEVLDLVLHKGDERGNYQGYALLHQGRDLETDGLASSGRKHGQHVRTLQGGGDYRFLLETERAVAPVLPKHFQRILDNI